jgi:chemotaxis regulatin CheY-phosphate phosphatase CheZ
MFSDAEKKLIQAIDPHWRDVIEKTTISSTQLYRILCMKAFLDDMTGPHVEALKRVSRAIESCTVYRLTREFDELCEFDLR